MAGRTGTAVASFSGWGPGHLAQAGNHSTGSRIRIRTAGKSCSAWLPPSKCCVGIKLFRRHAARCRPPAYTIFSSTKARPSRSSISTIHRSGSNFTCLSEPGIGARFVGPVAQRPRPDKFALARPCLVEQQAGAVQPGHPDDDSARLLGPHAHHRRLRPSDLSAPNKRPYRNSGFQSRRAHFFMVAQSSPGHQTLTARPDMARLRSRARRWRARTKIPALRRGVMRRF